MKDFSVCAGIVAHNPRAGDISILIEKLLFCAQWVVIVDNCSSNIDYLKDLEKKPEITVISNRENKGVSGGINQIIQYAREVEAKYVTTYDQDTQISKRLIGVLAADLEHLIESGESVAAIGPLVLDDFTDNILPFIHFKFPFNARYKSELLGKSRLVECHFLISSGCLMSMAAVDEIGLMNEDLFIDNVDLDWCFRAISRSYKIYGDFGSVIRQRIGERCTQIPFTSLVIRHHNANRNYYMTRNRFWLYRQTYVNGAWVYHDIYRSVSKFLYLLIFGGGRFRLVKSSIKGIGDSFAMKPARNDKQ